MAEYYGAFTHAALGWDGMDCAGITQCISLGAFTHKLRLRGAGKNASRVFTSALVLASYSQSVTSVN